MKININIEISPSELIELQDVIHESAREVVTKLSSEGIAHKISEHLEEEASSLPMYHIPADHMETGTVIQGKPPREPEAASVIQPGDLVKCQWPDENFASRDEVYRVEEIGPLDKTAMIQPMRKTLHYPLCARVEWLSKVVTEPVVDPEYYVGDLVELPWEKNGYGFSNRLFSITELHDDDTVSLREINSFPTFMMTNIPKSWIRRPRIKVELTE